MTVSPSDLSIEALTLPHEDPLEHRRIYNEWMTAYPGGDPIEQEYINQGVTAQINRRRVERTLTVLRTERVRTADLFFDREQEDYVYKCLSLFSQSCEWGLRELTRSAAGCRKCISYWEKLEKLLAIDGTWYGQDMMEAIQLLGVSACIDELFASELAYQTWLDCLVCQPNPKQKEINRMLDPMIIPKGILDRDVKVWPGNPALSRARLDALVVRELTRLRALEQMLRVQYEVPACAQAQQMALARITKDETALLRAGRMYEQSYERATTALMRARKQSVAARATAAVPQRDETTVVASRLTAPPNPPAPAPPAGGRTVVGRSEHRSLRTRKARALGRVPGAELSEVGHLPERRERLPDAGAEQSREVVRSCYFRI